MSFGIPSGVSKCGHPSRGRPDRLLSVVAAVLLLAGCRTVLAPGLCCADDPVAASSPRATPDFSPFNGIPKGRVGSIPCPGPLTFYATGDPARLGNHSYSSPGSESERGIIYTLHGGFIDIAHARKAADWTAYHQVRILHALDNGWNCIVLPSKEGSISRIRFNLSRYPASQRIHRELSIRLAQRLAITQTAWHEIATWFGYSCTPYPEKPSAFTYDDMTSHVLGANVAGLALHDSSRDFNAAVTWYLKQELDRLGAVPPDQTLRALAMVENRWWRNGLVIKRQLDIGEGDGKIQPWIAPGYPDGRTAAGVPFILPSLKDVAGLDMSGFAEVEMEPRIPQWASMRHLIPGDPQLCHPATDFPILMRYIRAHE